MEIMSKPMYRVIETIETDMGEGANKKQAETSFKSYGQAVAHVKNRLRELIRKDTIKFFRGYRHNFSNFEEFCNDEFNFWLEESDDGQFCYVASYLGWSCFWKILEA